MKRYIIWAIISCLIVIKLNCAKRSIINIPPANIPSDIPTVVLEGTNILKEDTSDANYCTHYKTGSFRVDSEGNLWVVDWGRMGIVKYNSKGEYQCHILLRSDSILISKEPPEFNFALKNNQCPEPPPVQITYFWFDRDDNIYMYIVRSSTRLARKWYTRFKPDTEIWILNKDGSKQIKKSFLLSEYAISDTKNRVYLSLHSLMWSEKIFGKGLIGISDSQMKAVTFFCPPIFKNGWNESEMDFWNKLTMATDEKDNLWVAFLSQPIVRKYDPHQNLLFEKKYLTSEISKKLAIYDSIRSEDIKRFKSEGKSDDDRPAIISRIIASIIPFMRGKVLLFTTLETVYELSEKGDIVRKYILSHKGNDRVCSYVVDHQGTIYGLYERWIYPYVRQVKIFKFAEQRKEVERLQKDNILIEGNNSKEVK